MLQHSRFPQLVTHWGRPWPHLLVEPRCKAPAGWPPLVRLSRAGPQVGRRLGLCPAQEARGIQHRAPVGGTVG